MLGLPVAALGEPVPRDPGTDLRVATFGAALSRDGPGLLLRDILAGDDPGVAATVAVIAAVGPDVIVLTDIDHDHGDAALGALRDALRVAGADYPHAFAPVPNSGLPSGQDLDANGRLGEARDALGYGRFPGQGGIAILSRHPLGPATDLTGLLWRDLPGAVLPMRDGAPFLSDAALAVLPLSSTAHVIVPVLAPSGPFDLMAWSATPPVFDGPEDMNGLRGADELRLWSLVLDGVVGAAPAGDFVIAGNSNLDPADGDGRRSAMAAFLADPRLQDPGPGSAGGRLAADPGQAGDPGLDTADWPDGAPGNLRVSYVLPSAGWTVTGAGVFWPAPDDPARAILGEDGLAAGPHRLVWVDLRRPGG